MGSLLSVYSSLSRERNVCPITYVAVAVFITADADNRAVRAQSYC